MRWLPRFLLAAKLLVLAACTTHERVDLLAPKTVTGSGGAPSDAGPPVVPSATATTPPSTPDAAAPDGGCRSGCSPKRSALSFYGPYDHVLVPSSEFLDVPSEFTWEVWVFVRSYRGGHAVLNRWIPNRVDVQLTFGLPEAVEVGQFPFNDPVPSWTLGGWIWTGVEGAPTWSNVTVSEQPLVGQWHHLALVLGGGSLRLYVDGVGHLGTEASPPAQNAPAPLYIGAAARNQRPIPAGVGWWPPIDGVIRDVRLSKAARYSANFVPETRLSVDAATTALWPLDEGAGATAFDLGPHSLHGAIQGASWVPVSGSLSQLPAP